MNIDALMVLSAPAAIAALMSSPAKGLRVLAAAFLVALCLAVPDAAAAEETPRLRAWWALQQRAYPLGHIPAGAQAQRLEQHRHLLAPPAGDGGNDGQQALPWRRVVAVRATR